jgi:putative hydrolase of the HAD superfamily
LAKANKENSIMIGDSLDADVQGALDMGLDAIFLIRIKFKWNKK